MSAPNQRIQTLACGTDMIYQPSIFYFLFFIFCGCGLDSFDPPSPSFPPCVPPPLPIHPSPSNKTEIRHKSSSGSKSHPLPFENKYPVCYHSTCPQKLRTLSERSSVYLDIRRWPQVKQCTTQREIGAKKKDKSARERERDRGRERQRES